MSLSNDLRRPIRDPLQIQAGSHPSSSDVLLHTAAIEQQLRQRELWSNGFGHITEELSRIHDRLPSIGRNDSMIDQMTRATESLRLHHRRVLHMQSQANSALRDLVPLGRETSAKMKRIEDEVYQLTDTFNFLRDQWKSKALLDNGWFELEEAFRADVAALHSQALDAETKIQIRINTHRHLCEEWWERCRAAARILQPNLTDPDPSRIAHYDARSSHVRPIQSLGGQLWTDVSSIRPEDVIQGGIGDCWFAGTMASLAMSANGRQMIHDMILDNGDGTFTVTFPGALPVIVDGDVYVGSDGNPLVGHGPKGGNYWFTILEKAYAMGVGRDGKNTGSYGSMDGGGSAEVFGLLGLNARLLEIPGASTGEVERMLRNANRGIPTTVGLDPPLFGGNHLVSVVRVENGPPPLVIMRNPHGNMDSAKTAAFTTYGVRSIPGSGGEFTIPLDKFMKCTHSVESTTWPT